MQGKRLAFGSDQTLLEEHDDTSGSKMVYNGILSQLIPTGIQLWRHTPDQFPRIVGDNNVLFNHFVPLESHLIVRVIALH